MADQVLAALNRTAASLTLRLQNRAVEMGWPEDLARALSVVPDADGNMVPQWPADREHEVLSMEGGTPDRLPRPALFSTFNSPDNQDHARQVAREQVSTVIEDLGRRMFS